MRRGGGGQISNENVLVLMQSADILECEIIFGGLNHKLNVVVDFNVHEQIILV